MITEYTSQEELESLVQGQKNSFITTYKGKLTDSKIEEYLDIIDKKTREIMIGLDENLNPITTDIHLDMAKDSIDEEISTHLGRKETFKPKTRTNNSGSGFKTSDTQLQKALRVYEVTLDAANGNFGGLRTGQFSFDPLFGGVVKITPKTKNKSSILSMGFDEFEDAESITVNLNTQEGLARLARYATTATPADSENFWGIGAYHYSIGHRSFTGQLIESDKAAQAESNKIDTGKYNQKK
jgi:hypothetical protein